MAAVAIVINTLMMVTIFYELFQKQVMEDLKMSASLITLVDELEMEKNEIYNTVIDKIRITVVGIDGTVTYDSEAEIAEMENHSNREEIVLAYSNGEGQSIRKSDTMEASMYYYALRLEDGSVLRVSKEAGSIWSIIEEAILAVIGVSTLLLFLCLILGSFLTKNIIGTVEKISKNLEQVEEEKTYEELLPFIRRIKKQHEDIIKAARMRQDFTANVSHELKTPLTSISGYSELIETGFVPESDVQRFAHEIHKNATRLLTLINDIIRLSELDAIEEEAQFEEIDICEIAQTCVDMLQVNAESNQVSLTFWGEKSIVMSTKEMIEEVVYNLCDNAIRYNNLDGSVHVLVKTVENKVILSVRDTGIGISKKHQERIFERFYRVDKSRSKLTGGTGLGLAIVKHSIAQMNANIEIISEEGKGTEIIVTFP